MASLETSLPENNIHKSIKFETLTKLLEKLSQEKTNKDREKALKLFLEKFNSFKSECVAKNQSTYVSFFPILRLLLPKLDRDREAYGLKDIAFGRLLIKVLGINEAGKDGHMLKTSQSGSNSGDFGDIVFRVMQDRGSSTGVLTIFDINECLDNLASGNKEQALSRVFLKLTSMEAKWLTRIVLKEMHIGIGQSHIFSYLHPKANRRFAHVSSLKEICDFIEQGDFETEREVKVFVPFAPQLCERFNYHNLDGLLRQKEYFVETKMDGERQQLHRSGQKYQYFTRQGFNVSSWFGETPESGKLTPFIHSLFKTTVTDMILDGEMMVWHKSEHRFMAKGENVEVRKFKTDTIHQVCFCVYDILRLNGTSLLQQPYVERARILETLFDNHEGRLVKVLPHKCRTSKDVLDHLNQAIDDNEEGIVIKAIDSTYSPGERGCGWFKIKPDYLENFISDLDLVVLGVHFKRGKTTVESFVVGVRETDDKFLACGSVKSGLTHADFGRLRNFLERVWKPAVTVKENRRNLVNHPSIDFGLEVPDVVVDPEHSTVLTILASELQKSSQFATEFTLRFPRITGWREDKPVRDCCSLEEFRELCQGEGSARIKKLTKRHATIEDLGGAVKRPRKTRAPAVVANPYVGREVEKLDGVLEGRDICVLNSKTVPKEELEDRIRLHGGRPVANPGKNTHFCLAETETFRVRQVMKERSHTIVKTDWALRALPRERVLKLGLVTPKDVLSTTLAKEEEFRLSYDEFGDHFREAWESTRELEKFLESMEIKMGLTDAEMLEVEEEIGNGKVFSRFRGKRALFKGTSRECRLARMDFLSRGGTLCSSAAEADLIVVEDPVLAREISPSSLLSGLQNVQ